MNKVVYKWGPLSERNNTTARGRIVHAEYRDQDIFTGQSGVYIWTEVTETDTVYANYRLFATGYVYEGEHQGTCIEPNGLVWHVIKVVI